MPTGLDEGLQSRLPSRDKPHSSGDRPTNAIPALSGRGLERKLTMTNFAPSNLKDISIVDGGRKVVIINKEGVKKDFTALGGKLAAATMVDGAFLKIKCTDGRTVIKWNTHTGSYT